MTDTPPPKPKSGLASLLVDYGPLFVFLGVYLIAKPAEEAAAAQVIAVIASTGAFMIAAVVALVFSIWKFRRVSPMLWLSTALIIVFGGVTVLTGDQRIIQAKPTVLYASFGILLLIGILRGKALLRILLEAAFEGLEERGWMLLSRNWGVFFLFLAALNQGIVETQSFEFWLWAKFWIFLPLTFLFTFTQIPMLLKHGLGVEEEAIPDQPPRGE